MTARQMFAFSYSLLVRESGGRAAAEKVLVDWSDAVKLKESEWRAANDPTWGETEEAEEHLLNVFSAFGGGKREVEESK